MIQVLLLVMVQGTKLGLVPFMSLTYAYVSNVQRRSRAGTAEQVPVPWMTANRLFTLLVCIQAIA